MIYYSGLECLLPGQPYSCVGYIACLSCRIYTVAILYSLGLSPFLVL